MRIFIVLLLLFAHPALAQQTLPKARPFSGEVKSLEPEPEKKKEPGGPKLNQPNVEMWPPPDFQANEGPWPLIIFSHGFGGCAKQSNFLTSHLAEHGYIVIAPDHADARRCGAGRAATLRGGTKDWPERSFRNPEKWDDTTEADRRDDILFAVSSMFDDRKYASFVDKEKMGLIGYSLGGYTALGLAGAWPKWKDARFKAVLAMSPYLSPYLLRRELGTMDVPVMYQGGTKDTDITPLLKKSNGAYAISGGPKYFMELEGADHFAWTELQRDYQSLIQQSALAFFDKYLKGEERVIDYSKDKRVKTFRKDEESKK